LRGLGSQATILVAARYPFQAQAARRLGASEVMRGDLYAEIARRTGGTVLKPMIGKPIATGGVDRVFECVGSDSALDDALRLARRGGTVVLVGVPGIAKGLDWTSVFIKELTLTAAYTYHRAEHYQGRAWTTFELAIELMASGTVDLGWMVTHRFKLEEYDKALRILGHKGTNQAIKAVFEFE
jgi:threonine dehydrogenase-like Zn-dependent dehydrogenase